MATIKCPDCGREVSDQAPTCPGCGRPIARPQIQQNVQPPKAKSTTLSILAFVFSIIGCTFVIGGILAIIDLIKNKNDGQKHWGSYVALVLCALFTIGAIGYGSSNTESTVPVQKVESISEVATKTEEKAATIEEPQQEKVTEERSNIFHAGEIAETKELKITYVGNGDYDFDNEFIQPKDGYKYIYFEFIFENISKSDQHVSTMIDWECYADNKKVDQTWDLDNNGLDATLSSGREAQGIVIFEVPIDAKSIELEYDINFWLSDKIIFVGK